MAEKKGLIYRLTMGKDNNPDFTTDRLPGNRWQVFKDVFSLRMGALFKINLLMLLFALPAIAWILLNGMMQNVLGAYLPYSANLGFGYPGLGQVRDIATMQAFANSTVFWAMMVPLLMIAGIGLAGGFHTVKLLVWGEGISARQTFFKGIKNNLLIFLLSSLVISGMLFLLMFSLNSYTLAISRSWLTVVGIIMTIVTLVLLVFMVMYITTQAVTYQMGLWALIKNSFIFSIALLPQNIFFVALSGLPLIIWMLIPSASMIVAMFYILIGLSYTILVWTIYAHYVYDKFLNDRIAGAMKDRGIYRKQAEEAEKKRQENIKFAKAAKKRRKNIKSIDEGKTFTPLPTTFSRADLDKLAAEKAEVREEIEQELSDLKNIADEPNDEDN